MAKKTENLVWNVYYHDENGQKISTFNVFQHGGFMGDVRKHLKKITEKDLFAKELERSLFYYFASKCEWEILIYPWGGGRNTKEIKIDVYNQVKNNWDVFVDYVWDSKRKDRQ